jgi:uncharacterized membrane protein
MTAPLPPPAFAAFRFEGVDPGWAWLWLLLLVAGAALLGFTYWGIFQRSERRLTWGLMLLRGVGLLLLVLALAKPTWTRENEQVEPGRVVVVVDNSRSMSLPDASGTPRYARARAAVEQLTAALGDSRAGPRLAVDLFDVEGRPLKDGLPEKPTAERTDLTKALKDAAGQTRSRPVVGFVVVSDGMDNTGRPSFRDWEDPSVPVHGLGFRAADATDLDLAVRRPQAPERVMVHNEVRVEVPVVKTGAPGTQATVSLKRGRETLASQRITLGENNAEQLVPLTFTPRQPGSFVFTAAIEGDAGEKYLGNNAVNFPLRVDAEPIRVLYLEGYLRYEYKYLKARLEDDPDVALVADVRRPSPERPEGAAGVRGLLTEEQLKKFDVVILGDMEGGYLGKPEYDQLVKWLDGKGHSLLVLGGYTSFGEQGFRNTPLADVLPVVFRPAPPYQSEEPFALRLTERGEAHPVFTLTNDRVKNAAAWGESPPLQGMALVERTKPGAEVLAVNPKLTAEEQPAPVVAVQRAPGGGQVMVLAADTTWRWSRLPRVFGQSDSLYGRFWSQAVRWLAGRGLDDQRPLLTVSTDRADYGVGKKVTVRVVRQRRTDKDPALAQDLAAAQPSVEVTGPRGDVVAVPLHEDSSDPDVSTGEFNPSAGGRYEVMATLAAGSKPLANQTAEFLVQGADLELANTGTNPANLQALADVTGGAYRDVEQAGDLAGQIARKERRTVQVVRSEFWNSPWLFAAFLTAVTGEWFLRRRNHLV